MASNVEASTSGSTNENDKETRKRKAEDKEGLEWLKEALMCPVCVEVIREPPIYLCANTMGHSLCKFCFFSRFKKQLPCPVCRQKLSLNRSLLLEKLLEELPAKECCKYWICEFRNSDVELVQKHEEECQYRKIPCGLCEERITLSKLEEHQKKAHGQKTFKLFFQGDDRFLGFLLGSLTLEGTQVALYGRVGCSSGVRVAGGSWFLMNWDTDQNCRIFWITYCGPRNEAKDYKYTIKINKDEKGECLFQASRRCVPYDISHKTMKVRRCGILIDEELIQEAAAAHNNKVIQYSIKIEKTVA